ncbi:hypothetical protein DL98DRAFT_442397, partial [Cadophora sp. DSE1049]
DIAVLNASIDPKIILERSNKEDSVRKARSNIKFNFLTNKVKERDKGLLKSPPSTILDINIISAIYDIKLGIYFLSKSTARRKIVVIKFIAKYLGYS